MNNSTFPPVSVILPILNEERDLSNCISAILQQDYPSNIEVILALGPSEDKTTQIAAKLSESDSRIKLVSNPTGQSAEVPIGKPELTGIVNLKIIHSQMLDTI